MSLSAGVAYVIALLGAAPHAAVADPRAALEQRLGTAEVAYAECLDEGAIAMAMALVEPAEAGDKVRAACATEWEAYAGLRRSERRFVLENAPDADGPTPDEYALGFRRQFELEAGRNYTAMLGQARDWSACMSELNDSNECLNRARNEYDACLQVAVRLPSFTAAKSAADAQSAAMQKCEHKRDGLAVAARLAGASRQDRNKFRHRMSAKLLHAWRAIHPTIPEACGVAPEAGCAPPAE